MKVQQHLWREGKGWSLTPVVLFQPTVVFAFGVSSIDVILPKFFT
jgi:hypothetical protein